MGEGLIVGRRNGISNFVRQFHTYLDVENKTYKLQESLFGVFKWGNFLPLPAVDYVLIFRQLFAKCETCTAEEFENSRFSYYQVSIVHHKTRRIVVHETRNREEAFSMAKKIAILLKQPLLDAATDRRKGEWIKLES
jgi:hypothetical protein